MEPDFLRSNLAIIQQRWPELYSALMDLNGPERAIFINDVDQPTLLVDGLHLSSCFDAHAEAQLQASQVPESAATVWLYGLATGELQRVLLQRAQLQRLEVVMLSLELLRSTLRFFDNADWLNDQRVRLRMATAESDIRAPFAVVPTCLKFVDPAAARLRDLIVLELDTSHINNTVRNNRDFQRQIAENVAMVTSKHFLVVTATGSVM